MTPDEFTIKEHMLPVGNGHVLYVHDWGNKKAKKPIIYLHGGPGGNCKDKNKKLFDPQTQRVVFFDQRGGGRSTPAGKWHHNTTQHMAADITTIANKLNIDKFILTGGSWGSCLALYYAISAPSRVHALVITGVFTGSQAEINWVDQGLFKTHFPDAWDSYLGLTPKKYQANPSEYHFKQAVGADDKKAKQSAFAYSILEGSVIALDDTFITPNYEEFDPTSIQIEMRYMSKRCFLPDNYILKRVSKLKIPIHIVQGRYDMVCTPAIAYEVAQKAQNATLTWVIAGHKLEHETTTALKLIHQQVSV
ncbi:MAG: alpha/beta fold hydrolase [Candidatus Saccharimonadales bacterium]